MGLFNSGFKTGPSEKTKEEVQTMVWNESVGSGGSGGLGGSNAAGYGQAMHTAATVATGSNVLITTTTTTGTGHYGPQLNQQFSPLQQWTTVQQSPFPYQPHSEQFIHMLAPIATPPSMMYRVPVQIRNNNNFRLTSQNNVIERQFAVWVGQNTIQLYTDTTLPACIQTKLAMVITHPASDKFQTKVVPQISREVQMDLFKSTYPEEYDEIGWRISHDFYCVVLDVKDLQKMYNGAVFFGGEEPNQDNK